MHYSFQTRLGGDLAAKHQKQRHCCFGKRGIVNTRDRAEGLPYFFFFVPAGAAEAVTPAARSCSFAFAASSERGYFAIS